jgi:hypothetical protein
MSMPGDMSYVAPRAGCFVDFQYRWYREPFLAPILIGIAYRYALVVWGA